MSDIGNIMKKNMIGVIIGAIVFWMFLPAVVSIKVFVAIPYLSRILSALLGGLLGAIAQSLIGK